MARKKPQIEARGWRLESRDPNSPSPVPRPPSPAPHSAFTLTELLVVITIIAILASLITAGAINALNAAKRARISLEINQLSQSMEEFKNKYGAYPPNGMNDGTNNFFGASIYQTTISDFERMFKKAFPRSQEPIGLIRRLGGDTTPSLAGNPSLPPQWSGMNAAEAIYFWLGGFSEDPQYPISGPGGPSFVDTKAPPGLDPADEVIENRNRIYEFDLGRLGPRDESDLYVGRFITYDDPKNGQLRQINLWTYAPAGSESSFAYFDASRHDPADYDQDLSGQFNANVFALKKLREGISVAGQASDIVFVNKGKFQILHSGLDDAWGEGMANFAMVDPVTNTPKNIQNITLFPSGPFTGDVADTLTNFTSGTLESAQE